MKNLRFILSLVVFLSLSVSSYGADKLLPVAKLSDFNSIRIDVDMELSLVKVGADESTRIEYDLRDNSADKFKFIVKPTGELSLTQSRNTQSVDRIVATIYYDELTSLRISRADVTFKDTFVANIFDLTLENGAKLGGLVDCDDIEASLNTGSELRIEGTVRYLELAATFSSKADLRGVDLTAVTVDASQRAVVTLNAPDRFEVTSSTKAVVKYWGKPNIMRRHRSVISAGEVRQEE